MNFFKKINNNKRDDIQDGTTTITTTLDNTQDSIVFGSDFIKNERGKWECVNCKKNNRRAESDSRQVMLSHVKLCLQNQYRFE